MAGRLHMSRGVVCLDGLPLTGSDEAYDAPAPKMNRVSTFNLVILNKNTYQLTI
jgi:hypothetical protein